jgi:transcription initiation factor TFIIIB Brf1 subunit/transcription initiation factor TFIIB
MDSKSCECSHINQITDTTVGDHICIDCGLVIDRVFICSNKEKNSGNFAIDDDDFLAELLEKLHLPKYVAAYVNTELSGIGKANARFTHLSVARCLYRASAKLSLPITARDICAVSGFSSKKILEESNTRIQGQNSSIICISIDDILEKLCGRLCIGYKDFTLIKRSVKVRYSGFNPATVATAYIYLYCKKKLKSIKLKDICVISGISCMSVHRFIKKNDLSLGS